MFCLVYGPNSRVRRFVSPVLAVMAWRAVPAALLPATLYRDEPYEHLGHRFAPEYEPTRENPARWAVFGLENGPNKAASYFTGSAEAARAMVDNFEDDYNQAIVLGPDGSIVEIRAGSRNRDQRKGRNLTQFAPWPEDNSP